MNTPDFLLRDALLRPGALPRMSAADISMVISQARTSRLLASLAARLEASGALALLPESARRHFRSALLVHHKQRRDLLHDCESIRAALASVDLRLVLLKGGAYLHTSLAVSQGRLITDIDIIVPREHIEDAESALNAYGWESSQLDSYNESYYRRWSHETPALVNPRRGTTLDLHHNILPPTAGPTIDADLLFDSVKEVKPATFTLSLQDMVIHSATHLFHEGEFYHGLRDLWDLHQMLKEFPQLDASFWDGLVARARQLELDAPLCHALRYTRLVFETPVPARVVEEATGWAARLRQPLMDFLFIRAFRPSHPECRLPLTGLALNALYIRSHYLRMPLHLLLPHLVRKAWMRRNDDSATALDNK